MIISFLPQLVSAVIALATIRIYTEFLSPEQLGQTMLMIGILALSDALIMSSNNQSIFYFISKNSTKLISFYLIRSLSNYFKYFYILLVLLILVSFSFVIENNILKTLLAMFILIFYILLNPFKGIFLAYLNYLKERKKYAIQVVSESLITFLTICFFAYYFMDWLYIMMAFLISRILSSSLNIFLIKKYLITSPDYNCTKKELKVFLIEYFKYFKSLSIMGIVGWISAFSDRFIIASSIGIVSSGYYSVASGLVSRPFNVLSATFTTHFRPDFYNNFNNQDKKQFNITKFKWIISVLILSIVFVFIFYFFAGLLCDILLAEGYREKIQDILWLISIALSFSIAIHVYDNIFLASGNSKKLLNLQIYLLPIPIISIFLGGLYYGIEGAILGRIFSELIKLYVTYRYSRNIL